MKILIPLGGIGKRFSDANYTTPKPLIKVLGKPLLFWVIDNLNLSEYDELYITYNESLDKHNLGNIIKSKYPNIKTKSVPNTRGAAETIRLAIEHFFTEDDKLVVLDGDTFYDEDVLSKARLVDNGVMYFNSTDPKPIYSYIKLDSDNTITHIKEKEKISDNANSGCYVFWSVKKLHQYLVSMDYTQGEVYTSDVIKSMIEGGEEFRGIPVSNFYVLGTPQHIVEFSKSYKVEPQRFVFDLDNTLVTYPIISGDYTSVEPIQDTINYLQKLKEAGHHIIVYTARRMRTHNGNVGGVIADIGKITMDTLSKFNIPYDELVFGKPYAHHYIDDLCVNPKMELSKQLGFYLDDIKPRSFNKIVISENSVVKYSQDSKLSGESKYYTDIHQTHLSEMFPKLISYGDGYLEIEKIEGTTFSELFINNMLTERHIDLLLESIDQLHSNKFVHSKNNSYIDYQQKIDDRYKQYDYSKFDSADVVYSEIRNGLDLYLKNEFELSSYHGDCVFTNIIFTPTEEVRFIDVKYSEYGIYGDPNYDYAKIYQSLCGYDEILSDKYVVESYRQRIKKYFESKFNEEELNNIKLITASLLFSLIPLHDNNKCSQYFELSKELL